MSNAKMSESETLLRAFFHPAYKGQYVDQDVKGAVLAVLDELVTLRKRDAVLLALESGGVDNWAGYHESLKEAGLLEDDDDEG